MKVLRGRLKSTGFNGGLPFSFTKDELKSVPKQLDWRLYGAVSSTPLLIVHLRKLCACFLGSSALGAGGFTGHGWLGRLFWVTGIKVFCRTRLPLASAWWFRLTLSTVLSCAVNNIGNNKIKFLVTPKIKLGTAALEYKFLTMKAVQLFIRD